MECQQLNYLLRFEAWRFCVKCTAWVCVWCDNLSEGPVKVKVANSCSLVDCCQFRNGSIDFVKYLTASESNVKIIMFTTY